MDIQDVYILDTETTGLDCKTAEVVELAVIGLSGLGYVSLVKPSAGIPAEVSAVHHITEVDVATAESWADIRRTFLAYLGENPVTLVAHNAGFDQGFIGEVPNASWICTYKAALRVWPDAPNHKNETLRYWLNLGPLGRSHVQGSHSAFHDANVTRLILIELLKHATLEQMIEWTKEPGQLPKMPMGKHMGQAWNTIPAPYLDWCIKAADMRDDVVHCAKKELERRRNPNATPRSG